MKRARTVATLRVSVEVVCRYPYALVPEHIGLMALDAPPCQF
jgi:hypothetical protein